LAPSISPRRHHEHRKSRHHQQPQARPETRRRQWTERQYPGLPARHHAARHPHLTDELIEEGTPVCAHPTTGYYIAATREEVDSTYDWLRSRGLHSLKKASQLRAAFHDGGVDPIDQLEQSGAFAS
jgi:hypothetical protein